MSLTLRDAQHVSWKTFRLINDKLDPEKGKMWTPLATLEDMRESVEDILKSVTHIEESEMQKDKTKTDKLATRLSDVLYAVFVLAEHYRINVEEVFMETMNDRMIAHIH